MTLRLFNSLGRKKEVFRPPPKRVVPVRNGVSNGVGIYVCGITPYGVTHLGHAFTYTFFDVLARYLRHLGYAVTYVQNVTDIDDDMLRQAKAQKKNWPRRYRRGWRKLGEENTQQFLQDMEWLHNLPPTLYVRATDHIPEIQVIIQKLLRKKLAYVREGSVYFEIAKDKQYGKLSRLSAKQMLPIANERGNNPNDPNKKHTLDFVLWQRVPRSPKGEVGKEPSWPSPWGPGRPGWHIECSAMSTKYLGQPFAIHGGGRDLVFPHHESEIAQSENAPRDSARGKQMAKYWLHTGMLRYQGEKMSKSLGNLVLIQNLKKQYTANTVRLALLRHHYREAWECTHKDLQAAQRLNKTLQRVWLLQSGSGKKFDFTKERIAFFAAMDDDINTPKALRALERLARKMVRAKGQNITPAKAFLMEVFHILGLAMEF